MRTLARRPLNPASRALLFVGPVILLLLGVVQVDTPAGATVALLSVVALVVVTFCSGVRLRAGERGVSVSVVPFWGRRLRWDQLARVDVAEVDAVEDFGGWGVTGSPHGPGILVSMGESRTVRLTTTDGRRYFVGLGDQAGEAVDALRASAPPSAGVRFTVGADPRRRAGVVGSEL
ncbi:hypothetical protein [Microbacterium sp. IEGM 1404]|uniref:hypothetical protein n=1 Tax=Microbacterium sp. IEGM 1404 TaxID=3047084 RepID=UPI0024B67322|nr:hypothetical protein [Microbacterium sp. IEGM 1404]MDI9891601.1 hypothetical protein [Microbacterium sp. IEGM 1404]